MLVVTPTLKAAQVAAREVGTAGSVAWLVHQHGYRWDQDGRWHREIAEPRPGLCWDGATCCWSTYADPGTMPITRWGSGDPTVRWGWWAGRLRSGRHSSLSG